MQVLLHFDFMLFSFPFWRKKPAASSKGIPTSMYSLTVKDIALGINCPKTINLTDLVTLNNNLSHVSLGKPV